MKVKVGGGLAGHNGLKSIRAHLHSDAFTRVRDEYVPAAFDGTSAKVLISGQTPSIRI